MDAKIGHCLEYLGYKTYGEGKRHRSRQKTSFKGSLQNVNDQIPQTCENIPELPLTETLDCNLEGDP